MVRRDREAAYEEAQELQAVSLIHSSAPNAVNFRRKADFKRVVATLQEQKAWHSVMLVMPTPLKKRLLYSRQAVADYQQAVADFLQQQAEAEQSHSKSSRRKHPSRKEQFDNQY
jgi:uncharacterized protein HemY